MTMCPANELLREAHIIGPDCREHALDNERFPVLKNAPFIWIGYSVLQPPYRIVRLRSIHSHVVYCVNGRGRTIIDGKVVSWEPGKALLGPVGLHHGFEVDGDGPWTIAWVFFEDTVAAPVLQSRRAELIDAEGEDFVATLTMLLREAAGPAQPATMAALVTLLDVHARRIAGTDLVDLRLWRLWQKVETDLARGWSAQELAHLAHMSEEHLRRLCHKHYQRSPMKHLTYLRLNRAAAMLRSSPEKVDTIARKVGYATVYSFSAAFRRWSGLPPGEFRLASTPRR